MEEIWSTAEDVATKQPDVTGEIDVNPSLLMERIDSWIDSLVVSLPNLGIAVMLIILGLLVGKLTQDFLSRSLRSRDREDLGRLLGGLVRWGILLAALAFAMTIVFPSLAPGDLFAGLGVTSVAIGFAFKDILQNWLAGLLLLIRRPFHPDDQIEVNGFEGTVEKIETRSTFIRTYDGQLIVIPNSDVYANAVLVKTHSDLRRSQFEVQVGFRENMDEARELLRSCIADVEGVECDPPCDVLAWGFGATHITLRCRWWTRAFQGDVVLTHDRIVTALHNLLRESDLTRPLNTTVFINSQLPEVNLPICANQASDADVINS